MSGYLTRIVFAAGAGLGLLALSGCDLGPKDSVQTGFRGAGLAEIVDPDRVVKTAAIPPEPYPLPPDGGPTAGESYQNIQVLNGVSKDRFDHLMAEITQWVAPPEQSCSYCHNPENLASDEKYTKVVARRMLQMTRSINTRWSPHVKATGVTCYTCHRGNGVPQNVWAMTEGPEGKRTIRGNKHGQNAPDPNVAYASLPSNPYAAYLAGPSDVRVASGKALPSPDHVVSVKKAEQTYGLMMHISTALGVNCTYCHNSQSFRAWDLSTPQRSTAYYGIRMVRNVNDEYMKSLTSVFPANRKGPYGDVLKVNCTTCHQGQSKPLGGVSMIAQAPTLKDVPVVAAAPAAVGKPAETTVKTTEPAATPSN